MKGSIGIVLTLALVGGVSCKATPSQPAAAEPSPAATTREAGRGFLGAAVTANQAGGPLGHVSGVRVVQIQDDSPASRSQLKVGDIIHVVNGQPITAAGSATEAFDDAISAFSAGQRITLGVVRVGPSGEPNDYTVEVQLGKRPDRVREPTPAPNSTPEQVAARMTRQGFKLASTSGNLRVKGSEVWTKTGAQVTIYYVEGKVLYTMTMTPAR